MSREPFVHRVIRASAGSGKTHQLTNRYLGLLAAGIEPDAILATTFTRKAAGEILERVLLRLAKAAGDAAEARKLAQDIERNDFGPDEGTRLLRSLLRNLHRVRIGTLDSFYIALAGSFSLEIGLPAGWSICEATDDEAMRQEALEQLLEREETTLLLALYHRLTQGETKRGVHQELLRIIRDLYGIHQETAPGVWKKIQIAPVLAAETLAALLERIAAFDLSMQARMQNPRDEDIQSAYAEKWDDLPRKGLSAKVHSGANAFYSKPIPEELIALYQELLRHAGSVLVRPVAGQTEATRDFLDCFHGTLGALKQTGGGIRFDEVTHALVAGLQRRTLQPDALAFRLDASVDHLLLDEFQDTSLAQWQVLRPIAQGITDASAKSPRSFFCVGDVKQAIFGWRGGMAEIFQTLKGSLGPLRESTLTESRRSAPPIIDVVNKVFGSLDTFQAGDKNVDGVAAWADRFEPHETVKKEYPGYVCLCTGPAEEEGQSSRDLQRKHYEYIAASIRELVQQAPARLTIGVLCRTNRTVARMIYELRKPEVGIDASEEGGDPLTDSPAVEVILSLFALADHPGHSIAWFHLQNSPLREHLSSFRLPDALAQCLRRQLMMKGYGPFTQGWAQQLALACDRRDLSRLQQLIDLAYGYQTRSTLRADDFVAWVRQKKVPDPSGALVRVMTIHAAKGLQFDAVVLPELDAGLSGRTPAFVVGRNPESLNVDLVCRYAKETVQAFLPAEARQAFKQDRQRDVEESLSVLYVAMTRAIHALHMYIPSERKPERKDAWYQLLQQALAPGAKRPGKALLYEHGDANWFQRLKREAPPREAEEVNLPPCIAFRTQETAWRRGLEHAAPSQREGGARVALNRLFHPSEGTGTAAGTLYHAWFEAIEWVDDGPPTEAALRAMAKKMRMDLPTKTWNDLDRLLAEFRRWLENPAINAVLRRAAYANPQQLGFPAALAPIWNKTIVPQRVERERRFSVFDDGKIWDGSLDRIVWLGDGERIVAADVIDFKTDAIDQGDANALEERTEHYRPQVETYRRVVARMARLPEDQISARLVFSFAGRIVEV